MINNSDNKLKDQQLNDYIDMLLVANIAAYNHAFGDTKKVVKGIVAKFTLTEFADKDLKRACFTLKNSKDIVNHVKTIYDEMLRVRMI